MPDDDTELRKYINETLDILRTSLELAIGDRPAFYRVAAVQLRLLLCDTTRRHDRIVETALIPRLAPELKLHPLVGDMFDLSGIPLALDDWLAQPLPLPEGRLITIRQLIRQVCDQQGGAHVDVRRNIRPIPPEVGREWILRIGEYLLGFELSIP